MFAQNNAVKSNQVANVLLDILTAIRGVNISIVNNGLGDASLAEQQTQTTALGNILSELTTGLNTANSPSHEVLTNPAAYVVNNFKEVSFVCSGTITVTLDGNPIIYPYTLGAATILGSTIKADTISTNSITFNGAGTVLITIQQ